MADIKNFGIVGVGGSVQYGKGGGSLKWDTDGFVSTSNGTTLADLDAATMNFTGLSGTGVVTVTDILDEDNMASDSATALATQQSIKAYVDSQTSASTLGGTGDSGAFSVNLATDTFGVFGGTNLTSTGSGSNVTVALDADISLTSVTATGTIEGGSLTDGTATLTGGDLTGAGAITATGTITGGTLTDGTASITGGDLTTTGTVSAGTLTDGTLSSTAGTITGGVAATFSGTVTGGTLTDGTASINAGSITGAVDGTFSGDLSAANVTATDTVTFGSLSDGVLTMTGFIDDDTMATASATTLATSESIKAYVDATASAADLDFAGDSGTGAVDLDSQIFTVAGGTGMTSAASGQTLTMNLDNTGVTAGVYGDATNIPQFTVNAQGQITSASNVAIQTSWTLAGDSGSETVDGGDTATFAGGTNITTAASATDTLTINLDSDISLTSVTATGNVDAGNVNATGDVNAVNGNFSGEVTFGSGSGGTLSGLTTITAESVVATSNIVLGGYTVTDIIDDDTFATANATNLPTAESVKAYVDAVATAADLDFQGDTGTGAVDLDSQALDIAGGTGIETSAASQTLTVTLSDTTVTAGDYGSATQIPAITVDAQGRITAASNVAISTSWTLTGDSGSEVVNGGDTVLIAGGNNITTAVTATDTATIDLDTTLTGMTAATFSGTVTAGTLTDGTASISSGAITGATDITATGTITGGTLTDGTLSSTAGTITGGVAATFSGAVTGGSLTDGTATLSAGSLTGAVDGTFSGDLQAANVTATDTVTFGSLSDGTLTMTAILDEDNMASDSATALATQQSIKAYVDSSITGSGVAMNIQGDTGSGSIVFATDTLDIAGTANEIETSYDSGTDTMTIGLPDDVTITGDLSTGGNTTVSGTLFSDDITSENLTLAGDAVITGNLTVNGNTTIINSNTIASGDAIIVLNADLPSGTAPSQDAGIEINRGSSANVHMLWKEGVDYFEFADENGVLQEVRAGEFNATTFTGGDFAGGNATISGDVAFGTLTDTGESITIQKFVDEADGIENNDDDTSIPTTAAVIDYVTNNAGDGNILRNGSVGTGANTVTIATVPNVAGRTYYVEKVVIKVTTLFSGNSVDHIIVAENGGLGTQIVTSNDADVLNTGTYVVESDGATELTAGQTITLGFRDSSNNLVAPTAGSLSCTVFYGWV